MSTPELFPFLLAFFKHARPIAAFTASAFNSISFLLLRVPDRPGGLLLIQILNYEDILATGKRHWPVNVRPGDGAKEIVFLRLISAGDAGRVLFFPPTLELDPDADEPLSLTMSRRVELRAWPRRSPPQASRPSSTVIWLVERSFSRT